MGTNFYARGHRRSENPDYHIGKRSAAGIWCWDCKIYIGELKPCPKCGAKPKKEKLEESTAGRELGFNRSPPKSKTGVGSASRFTWGVTEEQLSNIIANEEHSCPYCNEPLDASEKKIEDEYGRTYTPGEFWAVLSECIEEKHDLIGQTFS